VPSTTLLMAPNVVAAPMLPRSTSSSPSGTPPVPEPPSQLAPLDQFVSVPLAPVHTVGAASAGFSGHNNVNVRMAAPAPETARRHRGVFFMGCLGVGF